MPGSAEWTARADAVGRAMRLISDGIVDREGVAGPAARLGYRARQVRRQLNAEVGAGAIAVARILLETTDIQAAEIAFAAGFSSVRRSSTTPSGRPTRPQPSAGAGARTPPPRSSTTSATGPSTASSGSPGSAVRASTGAPCAEVSESPGDG
ncbi:hypothetical protein [Streptomyces sp. RTd22]|uniref:hypothetical protein n=1 Tax=Streptomyces sp. RTd22 TaxID=1841249 RepID=UPI000B146D9E